MAAAGKNGFKLSLRGYDDDGDWEDHYAQRAGRRVVPEDPVRSLLVQKPAGVVPHKAACGWRWGRRSFSWLSIGLRRVCAGAAGG